MIEELIGEFCLPLNDGIIPLDINACDDDEPQLFRFAVALFICNE